MKPGSEFGSGPQLCHIEDYVTDLRASAKNSVLLRFLYSFTSMSFESLPQGVCLIVQYHGAKALYFSDGPINPTAAMLFRQDLKEMRFPFPKAANIRLAPGATVVAWWPDVSRRTVRCTYSFLFLDVGA